MLRMSEEEYTQWCNAHGQKNQLKKNATRVAGNVLQKAEEKFPQSGQTERCQKARKGADEKKPDSQGEKRKYRNVPVYVYGNGIVKNEKDPALGNISACYASQAEYRRHLELQLLEKTGVIKSLQRQVPILIQEGFEYNGQRERPVYYVADFLYIDRNTQKTVVEDVKGFDTKKQKFRTTSEFRLKWKLLKRKYPDFIFLLHA